MTNDTEKERLGQLNYQVIDDSECCMEQRQGEVDLLFVPFHQRHNGNLVEERRGLLSAAFPSVSHLQSPVCARKND